MEKMYVLYIGIEGCMCRVRDIFYWLCMIIEIKEYIFKCDVCMIYCIS